MVNETPRDKLSFREFLDLHKNLEWIDRTCEADGTIIDEDLFQDTARRLYDKGFGREDQDLGDFTKELLMVNDEVVKDFLQELIEKADLEYEKLYEDFLESFYS